MPIRRRMRIITTVLPCSRPRLAARMTRQRPKAVAGTLHIRRATMRMGTVNTSISTSTTIINTTASIQSMGMPTAAATITATLLRPSHMPAQGMGISTMITHMVAKHMAAMLTTNMPTAGRVGITTAMPTSVTTMQITITMRTVTIMTIVTVTITTAQAAVAGAAARGQ